MAILSFKRSSLAPEFPSGPLADERGALAPHGGNSVHPRAAAAPAAPACDIRVRRSATRDGWVRGSTGARCPIDDATSVARHGRDAGDEAIDLLGRRVAGAPRTHD